MIHLTLEEIAGAVGGRVKGPTGTTVRAVSTDSRTLDPDVGALFVALPGEHRDGHAFVDAAAAAGAVAALVDHPVGADLPQIVVDDTWSGLWDLAAAVRDIVDPFTVGITGSVGKTTTKDLAAAALSVELETVAAVGSQNNELGVPLTLLRLENDSEALVCELGARGTGHIAELTGVVRPDVGVVTRVAAVHLELFGDLATVTRAKAELVDALPPSGWAVLNAGDARVAAMAGRTGARILTYAAEDGVDADLTAEDLSLDARARPRFLARTPWGDAEVRLDVAGEHNVENALAALAVAGAAGVEVAAAAAALRSAGISDWRGEILDAGEVTVLNDAYNANPTAVLAALDTLAAIDHDGRRWAVLGVMAEIGPRHDEEHADVGARAAAAGVDRLVVVGEGAAAIATGAVEQGMDADTVTTAWDAQEALSQVLAEVATGDVVLVKASRVAGLEVVAEGLVTARERDAS